MTYDAWNRLVEVYDDDSGDPGTLLITYRYDGRNYRIVKLSGSNPASPDEREDYYFNEQWQLLEIRQDQDTDAYLQYVWDIRYVDALVLQWRDSNTDGTVDETFYVTNDANMNVTALVTPGGTVQARNLYDPYGRQTMSLATYDVRILFAGYYHDSDGPGLCLARNRWYHPTLGRWMQRDPAGYTDGMSLYEYAVGSPTNYVDQNGLTVVFTMNGPTGDMDWKEFRMLLESRLITSSSIAQSENGFTVSGVATTPSRNRGEAGDNWDEARGIVELINDECIHRVSSVDELFALLNPHQAEENLSGRKLVERALTVEARQFETIRDYLRSLDREEADRLREALEGLEDYWDHWSTGAPIAGGTRGPYKQGTRVDKKTIDVDDRAFRARSYWALKIAWVYAAEPKKMREWGRNAKVVYGGALNNSSMAKPGIVRMDPAFAWNKLKDHSSLHGNPRKPRGFNTVRGTRGVFGVIVHEATHDIGGGQNTWNNKNGPGHKTRTNDPKSTADWKRLEEAMWEQFDHNRLGDIMRWTPGRIREFLRQQQSSQEE